MNDNESTYVPPLNTGMGLFAREATEGDWQSSPDPADHVPAYSKMGDASIVIVGYSTAGRVEVPVLSAHEIVELHDWLGEVIKKHKLEKKMFPDFMLNKKFVPEAYRRIKE